MATAPATTPTPPAAVAVASAPPIANAIFPRRPAIPPVGSAAAGGPTSGQLFPAGTQ